VAFHEAGHAETAINVGARVESMELLCQGQRHYGRTSVTRTDAQRLHIAHGGFAAEYRLYISKRLLKEDGQAPTEKEFIDYAVGNSYDDRISYFGKAALAPLGAFSKAQDLEFMSYAIGRAQNKMRFELVERIADALFAAGTLNADDLRAIVGG